MFLAPVTLLIIKGQLNTRGPGQVDPAVAYREYQKTAHQGCLDVGGHVVRSFGAVDKVVHRGFVGVRDEAADRR